MNYTLIPIYLWPALVLAGIAIILTFLYCWIPGYRLIRRARRDARSAVDSEENPEAMNLPTASVIITSAGRVEFLLNVLERLSEQTLQGFETIVVSETTAEGTASIAEQIHMRYPDVHVTFVPPQSSHLSRRKLAITLGMKAAKGDIAVIISDMGRIASSDWLRDMIMPFAGRNIDIVLGYTQIGFNSLSGGGKWYRQFDWVMQSASWIGCAIAGRAYRGDGSNISIRRSTFFEHNGFSKTIFLHHGEDDLFIYEVAQTGDVEVCISPEAQITEEWSAGGNTIWRNIKDRHRFTSRYLPQGPRVRAGFLSACQWIMLVALCGGIFLSLPGMYLLPIGILAMSWIIFELAQIYIYRAIAKILGAVRLWWGVPLFLLWRPIGDMLFTLRHRRHDVKHFTWQRHRRR